MQRAATSKPNINERGAPLGGKPQESDRRLFMQLRVFGGCREPRQLVDALEASQLEGALYHDMNDHQGVGLLTISETPDPVVTALRRFLNISPFAVLDSKSLYTMTGRTYSIGYEPDLEEALFTRPRRSALNPQWPWAVWYPLRRRGRFAQLTMREQRQIPMEHGNIGRAFGEADYAHDIRLACHGLDTNDNDFVIGLTGQELYPLSAIVQTMRRTKQTSQYLDHLGPFFVGKAVWQSAGPV